MHRKLFIYAALFAVGNVLAAAEPPSALLQLRAAAGSAPDAASAVASPAVAPPAATPSEVFHEKRTTNDMGEVLAMAQSQAAMGKEVLIAFDTDNTLLTADQDLGSEPWSDDILNSAKGPQYSQALNFWFSTAQAMSAQKKMRLVEESTAQGIARLQDGRVKTMILTSRSPALLLDPTIQQFADLGIDFSRSAFGSDLLDFSIPGFSRTLSYKKGVYCVAGQDKGNALIDLMGRMNYHPDVVIYVDNKQVEMESVYDAMAGTGTSAVAYRYGRMDRALDAYMRSDKSLVRMQTKVFFGESGRLISNEEAARRISQEGPVTAEQANELIFGTTDPAAP